MIRIEIAKQKMTRLLSSQIFYRTDDPCYYVSHETDLFNEQSRFPSERELTWVKVLRGFLAAVGTHPFLRLVISISFEFHEFNDHDY